MDLVLYSKPGCHLCEGLLEKLQHITSLPLHIEVRDITSREDWSDAYQFEIPVLMLRHPTPEGEDCYVSLPRMSPRSSVQQIEHMLQSYERK